MEKNEYHKMYNSIILSSCLFGSIYLFSTSLKMINGTFLENNKINNKLIMIDGLTLVISGSIVVYSFYKSIKRI